MTEGAYSSWASQALGGFDFEKSLVGTKVSGSHLVALVPQCLFWMLKRSCCLESMPLSCHVFAFAIRVE